MFCLIVEFANIIAIIMYNKTVVFVNTFLKNYAIIFLVIQNHAFSFNIKGFPILFDV